LFSQRWISCNRMRLDKGYFCVALQSNLKVPIIHSSSPPPLESYVIITHHTTLFFPYSTQFSYFLKYLRYIWAESWTWVILDFTRCLLYSCFCLQFNAKCIIAPRLIILCHLNFVCSHIPYCLNLSELSAFLYYHLCKQT